MSEKNQLLSRKMDTKISILDPSYIFYKFLIPDLKYAISKYATGRVLDIGCGNKPYKSLFDEKGCKEYIGCDIVQSDLKLVDIIAPATDIPLEDNTFDTVFSTQVLEHVFDHNKVIGEAYRLLKPGGYFIASLPMVWPHHEEPHDFFRFTRHGLQQLLTQNNFEIEYIKGNGGKWATLGQIITLTFLQNRRKPTLVSKLKSYAYRFSLSKVWVNLIFGNLDKISHEDEDFHTLNFLFVARKMPV